MEHTLNTDRRFEDRRAHERIDSMTIVVNAHLEKHSAFEEALSISMKQIADSAADIAGMMKVYQNTRGFFATLKIIGAGILWLSVIGGALSAIFLAFKFWIIS